ncbi:hypothetical protein J7J24_01310 [bacterium]|nr:hypothetical protein [bacterium]
MIQLIASILFGISIIGMAFLLAKTKGEGLKKQERKKARISRLKEKYKIPQKAPFQFNVNNFLRKFLIRLKIFLLKCENKIDAWLRQVSHSKKFNDDYWERFKK